ncbi:MAG: SRPBCC family protein, partial [Thermoleophilia bacterium]
MAQSDQTQRGPADYGREALEQWAEAARYGVRALKARREAASEKPSLKERRDPSRADMGGKAGDLADLALARLGAPGRLASKAKMGSRLVERVTGGGGGEEVDTGAEDVDTDSGTEDAGTESGEENGVAVGDGIGAGAPLPIQGSIDVALPVAAVFDLCTRFEEYPQIVDRVTAIEIEDETHFDVTVRAGKREQQISLELLDELPEERMDWEGVGELEHSGVLTFHPLAPRLTRLELTIERASEGSLEHLKRIVGLPERVLDQELRRFKAVAELWEDGKDYEPTEIGTSAEPEEPEEDEELEAAEQDEEDEQAEET